MIEVKNPVLPGFNPDPSICRAGDAFYIATSTFEWFPGVQIWESFDLSSWRLAARPLDRLSLLDIRGVQSSAGIWAPCLSYADGLFWLVYTPVRTWRGETPVDWGSFKDTPNYLTTAASIEGPWSEPVYLNSSGFDASLFHDEDGRKWLVNMEYDYRNRGTKFSGILLQEYDVETKRLAGPVRKIFRGSPLGVTEGPHLYRRGGFYYLLVAEGGTSYGHAATLARSRSLEGPYELMPGGPLLRAVEQSDLDGRSIPGFDPEKLTQDFWERPQKTGHASICPLEGDEFVLAHLMARPLAGSLMCPLGRETAIQRLRWPEREWPSVIDESGMPTRRAGFVARLPFEAPPGRAEKARAASTGPAAPFEYVAGMKRVFDDFEGPHVHKAFRWLRYREQADYSLAERPGWIAIRGRESPVSTFAQSLMGLCVASHSWTAETLIDFLPGRFQQMAGLLVRYDERNQHYLRISFDDGPGERRLGIISYLGGALSLPLGLDEQPLPEGPVVLKARVEGGALRFSWGIPGGELRPIGPNLDAARLSDEGAWPMGFTGTFACIACHDMSGSGAVAYFDYFMYEEG
jgi:xylan 1,4-beta-xylosidase